MRRIPRLILWHFGLLAGALLFGDVVTLKDGRQISGVVESGNIREIHVKVEDQSQTIDIHQVQAIQFGVSSPAPRSNAPDLAPGASESAPAQPNSLILHDGTRVNGRWWSVDATDIHFLVNNELQHYPRSDVSGVTFDNANLPPPTARSTPPAKSAPPPARPPASAPSPAGPAPQSPAVTRNSGGASPSPARGVSQQQEIGVVYSWDGKVLTPLERKRAVEHGRGSTQYWEMPGPQSSVRLEEDPSLVFAVYLPEGIDPASYSLFPLVTVEGSRRTRQPGRQGGLVTWPVDIEKRSGSNVITYRLTVRDLPPGEYSFSPSNTNDGYCFGVDPSKPGQ